jgi:hypothetical protein
MYLFIDIFIKTFSVMISNENNSKIFKLSILIYTVEPVYNEFPLIANHIVCTDSIDFFMNRSFITKTRF